MNRRYLVMLTVLLLQNAQSEDFVFSEVGQLVPKESGSGSVDTTVYAPTMRFPLKDAPAYANSQVYGVGGNFGPKGSQCDFRNFRYPWHDNFCETRAGRTNQACPTKYGHEGQDIRADTCKPDVRYAVAAENGRITKVGTYWVGMLGESGVYYSYLHMNPHRLSVAYGDSVVAGQNLGLVSDYLPDSHGTTTHLHFEIHASIVDSAGKPSLEVVSPYLSLAYAYQRLLKSTAEIAK